MVNVGWWASSEPLYLGEGVRFGDRKRKQQRLTLNMDSRTRHVVVIGGSGSGKSRFGRLLATQDVLCNRAFGLIDAQDLVREILWLIAEQALPGHVTEDAIAQLGDKVLIIEPAAAPTYGSVGYNFLSPSPGIPLFEVVDGLIQLLVELFADSMGPRLIDISRNMLLALGELGLTLAETVLFLSDAAVRNMLVRRCRNEDVLLFFLGHMAGLGREERVWYESSRNKWASFVASPYIRALIGQTRSTFSFEDILKSGKIVLINLSRHHLKLESRRILGGMFINALHHAAIAREDTPPSQRYLFSIYVDEAQSYWTETMAEILEAGRKYGLSLNLFFQSTRAQAWQEHPGSMDTIMANSHCRVAFSVSRRDAELLAGEFFIPSGTCTKHQRTVLGLPTERPTTWSAGDEERNFVAELMHQQPREAYVSFRGLDDNPLPYQLCVPHVPDIRPNDEKVEALRRHVAARYARPMHIVNGEIDARWARLRAEAGVRI